MNKSYIIAKSPGTPMAKMNLTIEMDDEALRRLLAHVAAHPSTTPVEQFIASQIIGYFMLAFGASITFIGSGFVE
jgi:hypothetical protein